MANIIITADPQTTTIAPSATTTFTVVASSNSASALEYEWYIAQSTAPSSFSKVKDTLKGAFASGENAATMTILPNWAQAAAGTPPSNGDLFKCLVKTKDKGDADVYTNSAILSVVVPPPTPVSELERVYALHGGKANFLRLHNLGQF